MVLGMSLATFTLIHVLNQPCRNCVGDRRDLWVPDQPKIRSLNGTSKSMHWLPMIGPTTPGRALEESI